ncbi:MULTISPECIES: 50S ribosomal protein L18Ae [unclassified Methanoculleus]|jgi:large subunit ribosomal protein LX|uniref:Large ribosomal subunit protein eL20 n=2 Tax=Methanoculleus TaxID=45989 RepID=A0ABD8A8N0_9EURY|nr:50S ribosomal protein L18Ae [Methanoculleus sp. UBA377]MDD2473231.1 50S ribosomal protein L18Ae [Methanoculleus sp.]WOX55884.1 50S ribosomal protein L18Ae [Methanoculleus palmolei]
MENQMFEVVGACKINNEWKPYRKVVKAPNENQARERVLTEIGSKHRLKRRYITIETVNVVAGE